MDEIDFSEQLIAEKNKGKSLNKPFRTSGGPKKFSVYVKNDKGNVVKVNFGDPNMEIKRDDPNRRKNFRARHNCDNPGPKWKARYWSCKFWSNPSVTNLLKAEEEWDGETFAEQEDLLSLNPEFALAQEITEDDDCQSCAEDITELNYNIEYFDSEAEIEEYKSIIVKNGEQNVSEYIKNCMANKKGSAKEVFKSCLEEYKNTSSGSFQEQHQFEEVEVHAEFQEGDIVKNIDSSCSMYGCIGSVKNVEYTPIDQNPEMEVQTFSSYSVSYMALNSGSCWAEGQIVSKSPEYLQKIGKEEAAIDNPNSLSKKRWSVSYKKKIDDSMSSRPGPKSSAQNPAKPEERKKGSDKNEPGSAGTKPDAKEKAVEQLNKKDKKSTIASQEAAIQFSNQVTEALKNKVKEHNEKYSKKVTLSQLKKVYRRGAGAFSSSHRPGKTRGQWAMARVNMFLKMLRGGKVKESYKQADKDVAKASSIDLFDNYEYDEAELQEAMQDAIAFDINYDFELEDVYLEEETLEKYYQKYL